MAHISVVWNKSTYTSGLGTTFGRLNIIAAQGKLKLELELSRAAARPNAYPQALTTDKEILDRRRKLAD